MKPWFNWQIDEVRNRPERIVWPLVTVVFDLSKIVLINAMSALERVLIEESEGSMRERGADSPPFLAMDCLGHASFGGLTPIVRANLA